MKVVTYRLGIALTSLLAVAFVFAGAATSTASAELLPYEVDPQLSLTGDCSVNALDPIPDPICPATTPSGRFNKPAAVAIDPYGNEYVATEPENSAVGVVDVFDDEGKFITELAGVPLPKSIAVDSEANLYVFNSIGELFHYAPTAASQPELGIVKYEAPPVTIKSGFPQPGAVIVDRANDQLLFAFGGVITRYKSAAEGNGVIATSGNVGSGWTEAVAIDAQRRRLYVSYCANDTTECGVKVLNADSFAEAHPPIDGSTTPAGEFVSHLGRLPIAVDEESGDVFIGDIAGGKKTIYRYDENYEYLSKLTNSKLYTNQSIQIAVSNGEPSPGVDAANRGRLFVPVLEAAGRVLAFRPPNHQPPRVKSVSTAAIGESEAKLGATIDPGAEDTHYSFEYTTQQNFDTEGFNGATVAGEGTVPGSSFEAEVGVFLSDLAPGTAYRFRVLAENDLGKAAEDHNQGAFATYADATASADCPNQALRLGPSSALPDCRAYELVTPADTNGRDPVGIRESSGDIFPTLQGSPAGEDLSFTILGGSLPGSNGTASFNGGDRYLATRTASGWSSALSGPSGEEVTLGLPGGVSPDQGYSFWTGRGEGPKVINGEFTHYLRYPDGHSELVGRGSLGTDPTATGVQITEGGDHFVFVSNAQLEPLTPGSSTQVLYDRTRDPASGEETTHVVSLLPGDVTAPAGKNAIYLGVSPDGEGIAFEIGGTLYLRKNNAITYEIGSGVTFAGVSEGGERVFYLQGGNLKAYDTSAEEVIDFSTTGDVTPVNVALGGTRAAFVSPSVLGAANPQGAVAQAGKENLYLSEEGQIAFIATLTERDVKGGKDSSFGSFDGVGLWTDAIRAPAKDASRLTPDGSVLVFQSRASLDAQQTGGSPQIYRYDSAAGRLHCLSCIPTGLPQGTGASFLTLTTSSEVSNPLSPYTLLSNLTPEGNRVFFESTEALVSADTDGLRDVYEWEEENVGGCKHAGGCLYLISSGHSATDNYLYGQSRSGDDVFFTSSDVLSGADHGATTSIYDARVGGGFAPASAPGECLGEACQPAVSAPEFTSPASAAFRGAGNPSPGAEQGRCPKGKRRAGGRGKGRCVAPKPKRSHHHSKGGTR